MYCVILKLFTFQMSITIGIWENNEVENKANPKYYFNSTL